MRIGVDIDGVLADVEGFAADYFIKYLVDKGIDYNVVKPDYDFYKMFGVSEKVEDEFWDEFLFPYSKNEKARRFAGEILQKLREEGNEVYIITARYLTNRDDEVGEKMRKSVKKWLSKNKIKYDKLVFSKASGERKVSEIKDYKIDVMIEDSPKNIKELSKITKVLCYDALYNRECEGENITRVYSWYDIYDKIHKL